jgi:hypothetical protein
MSTQPPKGKLRPRKKSDKITIDAITATRYSLERATLFFSFIGDLATEDSRWAHVHRLAVIDAGMEALEEATSGMDDLLRELDSV